VKPADISGIEKGISEMQKPEGKRPLGRPWRRWIDNIEMDILEIGLCGVDRIVLGQNRYRWRTVVNVVMNILVPYIFGKRSSGCTTCALSSGTQLHRFS
jgi:hypothetical protein